MVIVHSYAVGNGDMFSIRHASDNCTIIDCSISADNESWLLEAIDEQREGKELRASYRHIRTKTTLRDWKRWMITLRS